VLEFERFLGVAFFSLDGFFNFLEYFFLADNPYLAHKLVYGILTDKNYKVNFEAKNALRLS
jgi:hypothetical protein